jgi:hypothetical protein
MAARLALFIARVNPTPEGPGGVHTSRTRDPPGHQGPWRSLEDLFEGLAKMEIQFQSGE